MKKIFLMIALASVVLGGCKKEEVKPDCELNNTGVIKLHNSNDEAYDVYFDGVYKKRMNAFTDVDFTAGAKTITVECFEVNFILIQEKYSKTIFLGQCDEQSFSFGK